MIESRSRSRRETAGRIAVVVAILVLGWGTLAGSSPLWPNAPVYAAAAWVTAALWASSLVSHDRRVSEVSEAALVSLALMRGAGYTLDLARTENEALLAAIAAWAIVVALAARPLRPHA